MSTLNLLILILLGLLIIVGGKRGMISAITLACNFCLLFVAVVLIASGFNPLVVCGLFGLAILALTIYPGNDDTTTCNVAFGATLVVLVGMLVLIVGFDHFAQTAGFASEQSEEIEAFNVNIGVNFEQIAIVVTILSTLGALAEAAIAVASGVSEVIAQTPTITRKQAFKSGKNIGKQITAMTFNTLFFGMFGSDLALFVLLVKLNASFGYYLNSKIFVAETMLVLYSCLAVILVIELTAWLMSRRVARQKSVGAD